MMNKSNLLFEIYSTSCLQDIEYQILNYDLKSVSVYINLSDKEWELVDNLLLNHPQELELVLWLNQENTLNNKVTWGNLNFLSKLKGLKKLSIYDPLIKEISPIFKCKELKSIIINEVRKDIKLSVKGISELKKLQTLHLSSQVTGFKEINLLKNLTKLGTSHQKTEFDISGLKKLQELNLHACTSKFTDETLLNFENLRIFRTEGDFISEFNEIRNLKFLENLSIYKNKRIENLDFLSHIKNLKVLELCQVSRIQDFPDLSNLGIEEIELSQMKRLESISNLNLIKSLKVLQLDELPKIEIREYRKLLKSLTNLTDLRIEIEDLDEWRKLTKDIKNLGLKTYHID